MRGRLLGATLILGLLAGVGACDDLAVTPTATQAVPGAALIKGRVTAPRTLIGLEASGGTALEEGPVVGASVMLTDGAGTPIPGVMPVQTDDTGAYAFPNAPLGGSFVVLVAMKTSANQELALKALARTREPVTTVDVSTQSTLIAETALDAAKGQLGAFSPATFRRATEVLSANLTNQTLPDLTSREGMVKAVRAWAAKNEALAESLDLLQEEMAKADAPASGAPPVTGASQTPVQLPSRPPAATPKPPPPVWSATITMRGAIYIPEVVSVYQGGRVVLVNRDPFQHSMSPQEGAVFTATGMLQAGETKKIFFNDLGDHPFGCDEHPTMKGRVVVVSNAGAPAPPADLTAENPTAGSGGGTTGGGTGGTGGTGSTPAPGSSPTPTPTPTPVRTPFVNVTPTPTPTPTRTPTPTPRPSTPVSTFAGTAILGSTDGLGTSARFRYPAGLALDAGNNLFVADTENHAIRRVNTLGSVETWLGANAVRSSMRFALNGPMGLAVGPDGTVYVADTGAHRIVRVTGGSVPGAFAGSAFGVYDLVDGAGAAARFNRPSDLAVDDDGNVYVADSGNNAIRMITPAGTVSTIAGGQGPGAEDGVGTAARFNSPVGIVVATDGTLYVTDSGNSLIRKIAPDRTVTTLSAVGLNRPTGLAIDATGKLFVADFYNHRIQVVSPGGSASTHAGRGDPGYLDDTRDNAMFYHPYGVEVGSDGTVYVADHLNQCIRKVR